MGTVNLKMKLSAILIAAVSASPVAHDKDSSVAKSGKPMSGKPDMKPMSGHHDYKDQDGHDIDHDMEEEWKEFQDLMRHGKADNNIMNVNFAPINTNQQNWVNINTEVETDVNVNIGGKKHGKDGKEMEDWEEEFDEGYGKDKFDMEMVKEKMKKMVKGKVMKIMKYKLEMMKPYPPVIKALIEEMTGMDCEELIAMIEEKLFDGHKVAEVMWAIKNGHITKEDMNGMKFEDIKKMFEDHMADHSGDMDDIDVD